MAQKKWLAVFLPCLPPPPSLLLRYNMIHCCAIPTPPHPSTSPAFCGQTNAVFLTGYLALPSLPIKVTWIEAAFNLHD